LTLAHLLAPATRETETEAAEARDVYAMEQGEGKARRDTPSKARLQVSCMHAREE